MSRSLALLLITILVLSGLVMVGSVFAQSVPAPSTPTFTLKFLGRNMNSSDMNNSHIRVIINNQLLPENLDPGKYSIYYSIRYNHSSQYFNRLVGESMTIDNSLSPDPTEASITSRLQNPIPARPNSYTTTYTIETARNFNLYAGDQLDVQVKAIIGHNFTRWYQTYAIDHYWAGIPRYDYDTKVLYSYPDVTQDSESNWSETQTLTIPTPSPEPAPPEPALILGIVAIVAVFAFGLVLLHRIKRK
jgi:hypothetical protein